MFLSFIVPVYNTEKYIAECLDSLILQDVPSEEYEVVCVNDGSTDGSLSILNSYSKKYPNVNVITQKNAGVFTARNTGLSNAKGEYIWFVDSDDCILKNSISHLIEAASDEPDRIIIGNYRFTDGKAPFDNLETKQKNTIWYDSSACRSVFKKSFLEQHNLSFHYPELIYGEDALFMYEVKYAEPQTIIINDALYGYRDRENSASHILSDESLKRQLKSTIREAEIMKEYYESGRNDSVTADRFMSYLYGALYHIAAMPKAGGDRYEFLCCLHNKGLFPYHRPKSCTIQRSYQLNRGGDFIEKIHEKIYLRINTRAGFTAMCCWNSLFRLKKKLLKK